MAAGLATSGVFDLGALRDSPHVNDKVKLSEEEIQNLSPMRRPIVNKPLGIAYGTGELPAMIASSRDYHAYRSQGHVPGDLIPIANTNHFTILDELRQPNSTLTRAVIAMAEYHTVWGTRASLNACLDWDPIRAEHYGQRPHRPHT